MMAGELVCSRNGKLDDFKYIATLTKSYTQKALEEQASGHLAQFYWWDIPFFGGEDLVKEWPVHRRMHLIHELHAKAAAAQQHILPISILTFANPEAAEDHARKSGIEGWVVLDPLAVYGDKGWNLKGKPDRPSTCAKLKPRQEDDFIAFFDPDKGDEFGEWGTGKHEKGKMVRLPDGSEVVHGGVGSVALYQYNQSGELVYISKCSSGMDYAYQANLKKQSFPQVWQVEYVERTYISDGEKTNALRHPTFLRLREDKRVEECINPRL
jgi:ATP-dependent DNA ligase